MAVFIDEFLYRGRHDGSGDWHVVLGDATAAFGVVRVALTQPLTPAQAAAQGFDLKAILKGINATALQAADDLRKELAAKTSELEASSRLVEELQATGTAASARIAKLEERLSDELAARLKAKAPA